MAIPWFQIAKYVPSILTLSKELLEQSRKSGPFMTGSLEARVAELEGNERKQAELVKQMAEQIAVVAEVSMALRRQVWTVLLIAVASFLAAMVAIVLQFV